MIEVIIKPRLLEEGQEMAMLLVEVMAPEVVDIIRHLVRNSLT